MKRLALSTRSFRSSSPGSPYKRAAALRSYFRTTCPIQDLAEKYREPCGPDAEREAATTHAFRAGPSPELYRASTRGRI